ncbi:hypothetical protein ACFLTQ_01765 [Chloroflexota bacterium]
MSESYRAIVSSDWNECLAPTGPFEPISFNYPELTSELEAVFQDYTGNVITLGEANQRIQKLLARPLSIGQMDAYLDQSFVTYKGVFDLIEWCLSNNILFMINTTGMMGFFQRVFAKGLLPPVPVLSAHPMIRYPHLETDPHYLYDLLQLQDKGKNTEAVMQKLGISPSKVFIIGDSGGDGPHFKWGSDQGAFLIGSMTKPSLKMYCQDNGIPINLQFGLSYIQGEKRNSEKEMSIDFMELSSIIEEALK